MEAGKKNSNSKCHAIVTCSDEAQEGHGKGLDPQCQKLLNDVFYSEGETDSTDSHSCNLSNLPNQIEESLKCFQKNTPQERDEKPSRQGRLGSENVIFDFTGISGKLLVEADRLGVTSHHNFSTVRANTCVFKGKWVYELMLGSKGVMQVGWCTTECKFSQEDGVGDTPHSYAYDGNRLRKWNVKTVKYGESWLTGDVISCLIDCDEGKVSFCRNGKDLGVAFDKLHLGPGFAYFPAVSLSMGENLRANFGATPLRYPQEGHKPLEEAPHMDVLKAELLVSQLEKLLPHLVEYGNQQWSCPSCVTKNNLNATNLNCQACGKQRSPKHDSPASGLNSPTMSSAMPGMGQSYRSPAASVMLMASHIFDHLAPLLKNAYITEACLFHLMLKYCDSNSFMAPQPYIRKILDLLWAFLQENEIKACMEHLVVCLLTSYRFSPVNPEFSFQHMYLTLALAIFRHKTTRRYLLINVLFDKIKFPIFMHIKPPDDAGLVEMVPTVWWGFTRECQEDPTKHDDTKDDSVRKQEYLAACDQLRQKVQRLEKIQIEIMKVLLDDTDSEKGMTTRSHFLSKFREFLRENTLMSLRSPTAVNHCPFPVVLCFLHRLIRALRFHWDNYAAENPCKSLYSEEAYVPGKKFFDNSINYFDVQRVGGLLSHLRKTWKDQIGLSVGEFPEDGASSSEQRKSGTFETILQKLSMASESLRKGSSVKDSERLVASDSLIEILDGAIMLYNIAAHKQLAKMRALRENLNDYVVALEDTEKKLERCQEQNAEVKLELERAKRVFTEKATEQTRHMAWVIAVVYAKEKQEDVYWLMKTVLLTVEKAAKEDQGHIFLFVPDFYIETLLSSYNAIRAYFHPTISYDRLDDFHETLKRFSLFLINHFADHRVVNSDIKDMLVQTLACFVCYPMSLQALEEAPIAYRHKFVKSLMAPYENRSWAQTNWILVRLWKGCGFAFRSKSMSHLLPIKNQQLSNASLQNPCPSSIYQQHIADYLLEDVETATKLIDSLLNQLNSAFSEFIGMLQELQQYADRPLMASIIDSRQLKICATCFDISVGLLRVLEMIVTLVPSLLTDWTLPSAELLLSRLFQLLTQVLNRVTSKSNLFEVVLTFFQVPDLQTVDHLSILTSVTGILVALIIHGTEVSRDCATQCLLSEPGYQRSTLEYLVGGLSDSGENEAWRKFSFRNHKEISKDEITTVEILINHMSQAESNRQAKNLEVDEETICNICYARPKSAVFKPCGHTSCRACISHHLMNKKDCFFCKADVKSVIDLNGKQIKFT